MVKVITSEDRARMEEITAGLPSKSAKIRALSASGYERADIARFLEIRYQHVRNVLVQSSQPTLSPGMDGSEQPAPGRVRVKIGPGGRIVIPAPYRQAMRIEEGDTVTLQLEEDEVRIVSPAAGIRRAQEIVRRYVPEGVSLSDELIAERRAEVVGEAADG